MTETQVGFLCKAAASLQGAENNNSLSFLKSYYLMRCKAITKGYGLPEKQFSSKLRCSRCCIEWRNGTEAMIKSVKLSKSQRRRIKSQKIKKYTKLNSRKDLLHSNEIIQICTFCKQSTVTIAPKPENGTKVFIQPANNESHTINKLQSKPNRKTTDNLNKTKIKETKISKVPDLKKSEVNVYSITKEVFSLNNNKNSLQSLKKEEKKIIKNNKKKKDKYAGLCQKAVLASAKLKEAKDKQNKLNLFLKPSM